MGYLTDREVMIVGGGVAGLTAALALAQRGARVTLHEQADALREVGAGLQISPNAGRVLDVLGLGDGFAAISLRSDGVRMWDAAGRSVARLDFAPIGPMRPFGWSIVRV